MGLPSADSADEFDGNGLHAGFPPRCLLRAAVPEDLEVILDLQEDGSVRALSHIFPQDRFPFPRAELARRWAAEIADPAVRVFVITSQNQGITSENQGIMSENQGITSENQGITSESHGGVAGFAALRADQLLHLGTAFSTWGTGLASAAHAEIVALLPRDPWLWVFTENHRARRFYAKHGWQPTGRTRPTVFEPHPELMEYRRGQVSQEAT